jgi:hypothetical protein
MSCEQEYRSEHDLAVELLDWMVSKTYSASEETLGDVRTVFRSLKVLQMNKSSLVRKLLGDIGPESIRQHTLAGCMIRRLQSTNEWALKVNERFNEQMEKSTLSNFPNSQYLDEMLRLVKKLNDPGSGPNSALKETKGVNQQKYLCLVLRDFCLWLRPMKYWPAFSNKLGKSPACWGALVSLGTEAQSLCDYNMLLPDGHERALDVLFETVEALCQESPDFDFCFGLAKLGLGPSSTTDQPWWHLNCLMRSVKDTCEFKM